jgi:predicted acetyltransferase
MCGDLFCAWHGLRWPKKRYLAIDLAILLVKPDLARLGTYEDALVRGYSPSEGRPGIVAEHLAAIARDPASFVAGLEDPQGKGPPIELPDGSAVPRIPDFWRWLWDGGFAGAIQFRWQPGGPALPPDCLGHIGYSVVPWKRNKGFATSALEQLLPEVWLIGLPYVELTCDPSNTVSQKVIQRNGGYLVERFAKTPAHGGGDCLRYRIDAPISRA